MSELQDITTELKDALPKVERLKLQIAQDTLGIEIKPFKFIQFAEALETVAPILKFVNLTSLEDPTYIIYSICGNAKVFINLAKLAIGTQLSDKQLDELSAGDGIKIVRAVVKLNMDFFKEEVPQVLKDLFPVSPEEQEKQK